VEFAPHTLPDRVLLLAVAFVVSAGFGGLIPVHRVLLLDRPGIWVRSLLAHAERRLNRPQRAATTRRLRGVLLVVFAALLCLTLGNAVARLAEHLPAGMVVEILLLACVLPLYAPLARTRELLRALEGNQEEAARTLAIPLARRDAGAWDQHTTLRIGIELLALHYTARIVAPALWYLTLGLPAALFVPLLATMAALYSGVFSRAARGVDQAMQFLPARAAAILLALAALFTPGCRPLGAWRGIARGQGRTVSANEGVVLGAAAGALGLALGGARVWRGETVNDHWIECGSARAQPGDLARMRRLYAYACGIVALLALALNLATRHALGLS
jgi:adenosylcobinamide-phosphate synthase